MVTSFDDVFGSLEDTKPTPEEEAEMLQGYLDSLEDLCDFDSQSLKNIPMGMLHCPKCECMILAGVKHPKCDPDFCGMSVFRK